MPTSSDFNAAEEAKRKIRDDLEVFQVRLRDGNPEDIVNRHIKLLHSYNESKDAAQILMGKLAVLQGVTVRQLHEKYGLLVDD
ncbi:hypothetical protein CPB86DRAFT_810849 [Serendipita vermifera]|nr:hypothetical protein CPB86DRAFT_810849 [Serendipita vermifera]